MVERVEMDDHPRPVGAGRDREIRGRANEAILGPGRHPSASKFQATPPIVDGVVTVVRAEHRRLYLDDDRPSRKAAFHRPTMAPSTPEPWTNPPGGETTADRLAPGGTHRAERTRRSPSGRMPGAGAGRTGDDRVVSPSSREISTLSLTGLDLKFP
jgi:hypothetical protein